jgi:hypothetical protein
VSRPVSRLRSARRRPVRESARPHQALQALSAPPTVQVQALQALSAPPTVQVQALQALSAPPTVQVQALQALSAPPTVPAGGFCQRGVAAPPGPGLLHEYGGGGSGGGAKGASGSCSEKGAPASGSLGAEQVLEKERRP